MPRRVPFARHRAVASRLGAACALAAALACATGIPRYVRGDVASRAEAPLPDEASYAVVVAPPTDATLDAIAAGAVARALAGRAWRPAPADGGDVAVEIALDRAAADAASLLEADARYARRLSVDVRRTDATRERLWRAELRSDGAGEPIEVLLDDYLRVALSSLGRDRAPSRFALRADARRAAAPPSAASADATPPAPDAPSAPAPAPGSAAAPAGASAGASAAASPPSAPRAGTPRTAADALRELFGAAPRDGARATSEATTAGAAGSADGALAAPPSTPPGPEWRRAPGSSWQPARAPCEAVDERQAVTCAVEVVRATGAARLVVAYATVAQAEREWPRDAAATVDAFCGVAQRRGALASAEVVVRAAGRERRFGCDAAASEAARSPSRDQRGEQE